MSEMPRGIVEPDLVYEAMRLELRALRERADLTETELARQMGVNKSTVYRTEDTEKRPSYEPSLNTIEKWLDCTSGETLAMFFCRVEYAAEHDGKTKALLNDLSKYFKLRSMLRDLQAYLRTIDTRVGQLRLPATPERFQDGFERRVRLITTTVTTTRRRRR